MKFAIQPVQYGKAELFVMRTLLALAVADHFPDTLAHVSLTQPHGLAQIVDLSFLLNLQVLTVLRYVLWGALLLYVLRVGWAVVLPYMTLLSIAVGTVNNSQGAISHSFQILSLVLLAQTCAYYYVRFGKRGGADSGDESQMVLWSQQAIVATYLVSAITKLINSSGRWFLEAPFIAVQVVKATDQSYYNTLDPTGRSTELAIAEWIAQNPLIVAALMTSGFLLELLAPIALLGRRFALAVGVGLLLFHRAIYEVMELQFVYNEYLLWIYLVNVPFWLLLAVRWGRSRAAAQPAAG